MDLNKEIASLGIFMKKINIDFKEKSRSNNSSYNFMNQRFRTKSRNQKGNLSYFNSMLNDDINLMQISAIKNPSNYKKCKMFGHTYKSTGFIFTIFHSSE